MAERSIGEEHLMDLTIFPGVFDKKKVTVLLQGKCLFELRQAEGNMP
jgi:hypothetical protein